MNVVIIGDVHNKHEKVEEILKNRDELIVFIGDYFDDFDDTREDIEATAHWLKESIYKPNRIHLMGNHDFHYRIQPCGITYCSGFQYYKHEVINNILNQEDWAKIKFFHAIENYWFSHAGIAKQWFEHPVLGLNIESIQKTIDEAVLGMESGNLTKVGPLWAADTYRGGRHKKGGLLWNHWTNSEFHDGITQIMGHTPHKEIQVKRSLQSTNINVDTHLKQILLLNTEKHYWDIKNI